MPSARTTALRTRVVPVFQGLERLAGTRRGAALLVVLALVVYAFESIGWVLRPGRDLGVYLRYYIQLGQDHPVFPWSMLTRTPVTPLVAGGLLEAGGGVFAEVVMALLFAGSILAWSFVALRIAGRRAALLVAAALLVFPGYGGLFHQLSSDVVFAAVFAGWAVLMLRAVERPSAYRFAAAGAGAALLALTRPANQVLVLVALSALALSEPWRLRAVHAGAYAVAAVLPLVAWAGVNDLRYDDFTVARGGQASVPFFRAFVTDRIMSPDNGPASRRLAAAVQTDLLPRQPYRGYRIDLHEFFTSGSARMEEDLISLSDRVFGWDTDYELLGRAAREAVRRHPSKYARGVASSMWDELNQPLYVSPRPSASPTPPVTAQTAAANSAPLPTPTEGEPIPAAHQGAYTSTPDNHIHEVWTSPTAHEIVFDDPRDQQRYDRLNERLRELGERFPTRSESSWLRLQLNHASKAFPRSWLWLLVGIAAFVWRRPQGWRVPAILVVSSLLLILATVLGVYAIPEYEVPVAPSFILLAAAGLCGTRARRTREAALATRGETGRVASTR
jgi:4-amino-4-deoxy-L-arabinose transferase-like glycosyltransferase